VAEWVGVQLFAWFRLVTLGLSVEVTAGARAVTINGLLHKDATESSQL
jgi:hypothetical protein